MSRSGPIQKKATGADADAAATACPCLPQDVLASILVRLPASDLRGFRRVCKEWHEIISNRAFIDEHTVHGPRTLTHTIVFFPGQINAGKYSNNGSGFLFDDQWRLKATFSAARFDEMIGQCNGLLCFLDGCYRRRAIYIVEPFTGKSLDLPFPPKTSRWREHAAYCFAFDPRSRRYKVFHQGNNYQQEIYMYTIAGGESWRKVEVAGAAAHRASYGDPVFAHGSVYWSAVRQHLAELARFDLATEEVTSESIGSVELGKSLVIMPDSDAGVCGMTVGIGWGGESQTKFMGRDCGRNNGAITQPHGRRLALPQALQRDHLLLNDYEDKGLYAHAIAPASNDLDHGKLLVEACKEDERPASCSITRGLFVPVQVNQKASAVPRLGTSVGYHPRVFCYGQTYI